MNNIRKLVSVGMAALITFNYAQVVLSAQEASEPVIVEELSHKSTDGNISYTLLADGTAEISNFVCYSAEYTIPSMIDGYIVTSIGRYAFSSIDMLESVIIPDTVILIDEWAFYRCKNLKSVKMGSGVKRIEYNAFAHCYSLTEIELNKGLEYVGCQAFYYSKALTEISIPKSLTYIDESAFSGTALTDVYYEGSKSQWNSITIDYGNDELEEATIHYNSYFTEEEITQINNFVERLYTNLLGRSSDVKGKANHVNSLKNGSTAADIGAKFVLSTELKNKKLTNREFVKRMYQTFLDRIPSSAEITRWATTLDNGCSYAYILKSFVASAEFKKLAASYGITAGTYTVTEYRDYNEKLTAYVSRMYTKALKRSYDVTGLNNHTGRYINGTKTAAQIAQSFFFSTELKNKNLSDEEFVTRLYQALFDRNPDAAGKANWLKRIKNGYTREQVFNGFANSAEFKKLVASFGL